MTGYFISLVEHLIIGKPIASGLNRLNNSKSKIRTYQDSIEHYTTLQNITLQFGLLAGWQAENQKRGEKNMAQKTEIIEIKPLSIQTAEITIAGDGDLILNKMNDINAKELIDKRKDKAKTTAKPNLWEGIVTSMHWYNGKPTDFSEEGLIQALKENAPCITGFGLKKSFGQAVVQNRIDTYATKFNAGVNIIAKGDLVPITFAEHHIDEKLMSPKKGSPVLARLNRFSGWKATFTIQYTENAFSIEQIVNIINLAGFGNGIGSGRSSGYGRYHVEDIK